MTWLLASLVALLVGTNITITVWWRGATKAKDIAEDTAHAAQEQLIQAHADLLDSDKTVKAKTVEIGILKERLVQAEQERNNAYGAARDHFVQRLQSAGIADAAKFGADLLATDIRTGVMLPQRRLSDDPRDGLLDPDSEL